MKKRTRNFHRRQTAARPPVAPPAQPFDVRIEKPIYGGAFLARIEGRATFVPLALPGEQARVRIVEEKRNYATAEVEQTLTAAPERVAPACPHFGACGGCHYQHARYEAQTAFKQAILRETLERGGVQVPGEIDVLAAEPWAYRNRIRLAFDAAGNVGYRGRRSHAVVPIAQCPIAAPLLVNAALAAAEILRNLSRKIRPSEIQLFCNTDETALLASLTAAGGSKGWLEEFSLSLKQSVPALTGVELLTAAAPDLPPHRVTRWGAESLDYRAAGFDYRVDQGAFFQVNRRLVDALVERVTAGHEGGTAWDLFAGVGLFARRLASRFHNIVAVESAPAAKAALEHNLDGASATAVSTSTLDFLRNAGQGGRPDLIAPDLIVVDPPRTGLGADVTTRLAEIAAPALTVVSCDPATLARDLRVLTAAGYAIESVTLADLFPQTFHLETVVQLRR